jgi:hypothetical protein
VDAVDDLGRSGRRCLTEKYSKFDTMPNWMLWHETRCFSTFKISTSSNVEEVLWLSYLTFFEKSFFFKFLREDLKIF